MKLSARDDASSTCPHPAGVSNAQFLREPHFRLVEDIFQAAETGERKLTDRHGTDFSDRRFLQRRAATFFMN